jgi:cytochrome P450
VFDVIDRVCRTAETAGGGLTYLGAKMITASTTWVAAAAGVYVLPSFLNFLTAVVQRDPGPLLESTTAAATAAVQAVAAELIRANPPVPVELQRVAQEAVPAGVNFAIQLRDLVIGFAAGIEIRHVWRIVRNVRPR